MELSEQERITQAVREFLQGVSDSLEPNLSGGVSEDISGLLAGLDRNQKKAFCGGFILGAIIGKLSGNPEHVASVIRSMDVPVEDWEYEIEKILTQTGTPKMD